jgi:hypothetical protein
MDVMETARQTAARLERLSVDSIWARRACGLRGSLLKSLDGDPNPETIAHLETLIRRGHEILRQAAREIPDPEDIRIPNLRAR